MVAITLLMVVLAVFEGICAVFEGTTHLLGSDRRFVKKLTTVQPAK